MIDPVGAFERLRDFFLTYLDTAYRIRQSDLATARRHLLSTPGHLAAEPLLEPVPRYRTCDYFLERLLEDWKGNPIGSMAPRRVPPSSNWFSLDCFPGSAHPAGPSGARAYSSRMSTRWKCSPAASRRADRASSRRVRARARPNRSCSRYWPPSRTRPRAGPNPLRRTFKQVVARSSWPVLGQAGRRAPRQTEGDAGNRPVPHERLGRGPDDPAASHAGLARGETRHGAAFRSQPHLLRSLHGRHAGDAVPRSSEASGDEAAGPAARA